VNVFGLLSLSHLVLNNSLGNGHAFNVSIFSVSCSKFLALLRDKHLSESSGRRSGKTVTLWTLPLTRTYTHTQRVVNGKYIVKCSSRHTQTDRHGDILCVSRVNSYGCQRRSQLMR